MKLYIAADHAGFDLKEAIKKEAPQIEWIDMGAHSMDSVHYPKFAGELCKKILEDKGDFLQPRGVLICGSGVGMSIAANRCQNIRAVLALREDVAKLSREHNASNVLCLGARFLNNAEALAIFKTWIKTPFEGGRHQIRIDLIDGKK